MKWCLVIVFLPMVLWAKPRGSMVNKMHPTSIEQSQDESTYSVQIDFTPLQSPIALFYP